MPTQVRTATPVDAPGIVRLIGQLRAAEEVEGGIEVDAVIAFLAEESTVAFVATVDTTVVGVLTLRILGDLFHGGTSALVQELVVDESHRGEGHGSHLLDAAVAYGLAHGCAEISVSTGVENSVARRLYESRGFEQEGVVLELHLA